MKKAGLQGKVFKLCLFLVLLAVVVFSVFGVVLLKDISKSSAENGSREKEAVSDISGQSMENLVSSYFVSYAIAESDISDNTFWSMASSVYMLALQVQGIYDNYDSYEPRTVMRPSRANAGTVTAQLLYADSKKAADKAVNDEISRLGNLQEQMIATIESNSDMQDCVIAIPGGASIYCDANSEKRFDDAGRIEDYDAASRPWYQLAVESGQLAFSSVNYDYYTDSMQVNVVIPVYHDGELKAVCCGSMSLDQIAMTVENAHVGDNGFSCIINDMGQILFSNRKEGTLGLSNTGDLRESDNADLAAMVEDALAGNVNAAKLNVDGEDIFVTYAPLATVGWTQLMVIPQQELDAPTEALLDQLDILADESQASFQKTVRSTMVILMVVLVAMVGVAVVLSLVFAQKLVDPIKKMTSRVEEISGDDLIFEVDDAYRTGDEIEVLAEAFHGMSEQTVNYIDEITTITAEKQRIGTELSTAKNIQVGLLPQELKQQKGFRMYATMTAAKEVGGDFYDYYMLDDTHLCFLMADVSGKGVPAALFMATSKATIKSRAMMGGTPAEILEDAQAIISENNEGALFVPAWLAIIDLVSGHMQYCSAGHEYPGIKRAGGKYEWLIEEGKERNLPVAMIPDMGFDGDEMTLHPGDRVFLYTDGLPEAINPADEQYGMDRTLDSLNEVADGTDHEVLEHVWKRMVEYIAEEPQFDDTTMLSFTYLGPEDEGIDLGGDEGFSFGTFDEEDSGEQVTTSSGLVLEEVSEEPVIKTSSGLILEEITE